MIKFFQVLFFSAALVLIVLNILEFRKWQEALKEGNLKPYPLKWFNFILTSWVALGCLLNIFISWVG